MALDAFTQTETRKINLCKKNHIKKYIFIYINKYILIKLENFETNFKF